MSDPNDNTDPANWFTIHDGYNSYEMNCQLYVRWISTKTEVGGVKVYPDVLDPSKTDKRDYRTRKYLWELIFPIPGRGVYLSKKLNLDLTQPLFWLTVPDFPAYQISSHGIL